MCTDIERSPFSPRASQGQIVALRMGRRERRHCCSGACVQPKSALRTRSVVSPAPGSLRETACLVSQCCAFLTQESCCVWRSRGYFNCLATGESFKLDGLLLPVSVSQIAVFTLRDRGPVRWRSICRWVSGPASCCLSSAV